MRTDFKRIFLDTSPLLYYLDEAELYFPTMVRFWEDFCDSKLITSAITIAEYLVHPYRNSNIKKIEQFYSFTNDMLIDINHIDKAAAEKAAQIRAKYPSFKTADALQLAAACCSNCDMFLTNDKQLKQCKEIKCVTVDELKNGI